MNKTECMPTNQTACNVTSSYVFDPPLTSSHQHALINTYEISDYLCYISVDQKGFHVSTYYDVSSYIAKDAAPTIVPAC